ncbi:hypothetical protein WMY93_030300 [Mugilogobius chulae]|uniref:Uncharacterized protein n=1 Tax=Mugilogobius chulae TaxID=88201 RepID=A0AAW0MTK9_9GOBI
MSLTATANYASNTDHIRIDVAPEIWKLFREVPGSYEVEGLLNFVQLYCDALHRHQTPYYKHPVSDLRDLGNKAEAILTARVEGVLLFKGLDLPHTLYSECMSDTDKPARLVASRPALVPFVSTQAHDIRDFRKDLVLILSRGLETARRQRKDCGGYDPCWTAFQLELALEEYHYGQPRTPAHSSASRWAPAPRKEPHPHP